mmetsp:Transcript_79563/g.251388  ORF Transcript_79563/g.251388 Transcript_79563/m.251388 type:complete len:333 (-) Transcript_79563:36-1034(-)
MPHARASTAPAAPAACVLRPGLLAVRDGDRPHEHVVLPHAAARSSLRGRVGAQAVPLAADPLALVGLAAGPGEPASAMLLVVNVLSLVDHRAARVPPLHAAVPGEGAVAKLAGVHAAVRPRLAALAVHAAGLPAACGHGARRRQAAVSCEGAAFGSDLAAVHAVWTEHLSVVWMGLVQQLVHVHGGAGALDGPHGFGGVRDALRDLVLELICEGRLGPAVAPGRGLGGLGGFRPGGPGGGTLPRALAGPRARRTPRDPAPAEARREGVAPSGLVLPGGIAGDRQLGWRAGREDAGGAAARLTDGSLAHRWKRLAHARVSAEGQPASMWATSP